MIQREPLALRRLRFSIAAAVVVGAIETFVIIVFDTLPPLLKYLCGSCLANFVRVICISQV
jgi:hypothetical protein